MIKQRYRVKKLSVKKKKIFFAKPFIKKKLRYDPRNRFFRRGRFKRIKRNRLLRKILRRNKRFNKRSIVIKKLLFLQKIVRKHRSLTLKKNYIKRINRMQQYAKKRLFRLKVKRQKVRLFHNNNTRLINTLRV